MVEIAEPDVDDAVQEVLKEVEAIFRRRVHDAGETGAFKERAAMKRAQAVIMGAVAGMGECRRETPFAALRPVLNVDGELKWCCLHRTEHCGKQAE